MKSFIFLLFSALVLFTAPIVTSRSSCERSEPPDKSELRYKGATLAHIHRIGRGYGSEKSQALHRHLKQAGYNAVQLNTFAYVRDINSVEVLSGGDPSLSEKYIVAEIDALHDMGFKVMLKPHIWMGGHEFDPDNWRSNIDFRDPAKRRKWFDSYGDFIVSEAKIAEKTGVEIFVVGTELVALSKYREDWEDLIAKVRQVYGGELTYAANGMNAANIEFWDSLDHIGIDAYFRLTDKVNPTVTELVKGWSPYESEIAGLSRKFGKKVILTEIGFKSVEGTAMEPWQWDGEGGVSQEEQARAFEAAGIVLRNKPYLTGVFIWKYFTDMDSYEKRNMEKGFTPYGKKAERVISEWFGNCNEETGK